MLYRLSDLKRYNNMSRIKSESLAEHQYYCALILMKLKPYIYNITYQEYSILLQYVLIHDIGELYTGDIPHNVKEDYPDLKYLLEKIETEKLQLIGFNDIIGTIEKNENLKMLFKLCDILQVIQYCENEFKLGNSSNDMEQIYNEAKTLTHKRLAWLQNRGIIDNRKDVIDEILGIGN